MSLNHNSGHGQIDGTGAAQEPLFPPNLTKGGMAKYVLAIPQAMDLFPLRRD